MFQAASWKTTTTRATSTLLWQTVTARWSSSTSPDYGETGATTGSSASWSTSRRQTPWWHTWWGTQTGASTGTSVLSRRHHWTGVRPPTTARTTTASPSSWHSWKCSTSIHSLARGPFFISNITNLLLDWSSSKVNFCQKLILPKTVLAGKFIMLYRKLTQNNGLIVVWYLKVIWSEFGTELNITCK